MSDNNFQKREAQRNERRRDFQIGQERVQQMTQQDNPPQVENVQQQQPQSTRPRRGVIDPKQLEYSMQAQGLIEQFRNPTLTEQEGQGRNENQKVDLRLARQEQAVRDLRGMINNNSIDPEVQQMIQDTVNQYGLDNYQQSVDLARNLSDLSGVAQQFTTDETAQRISQQQFQQGVGQVRQTDRRLTGICDQVEEYLPKYKDFTGSGKKTSKVKMQDNSIATISSGKIEDTQGNTLTKPSFSDDPRSLGNVSQTLKRMLLDPDGNNDGVKINQVTHQGLRTHSSQLVRDTYQVAMNSYGQINPQRVQSLQNPQPQQNITNNNNMEM